MSACAMRILLAALLLAGSLGLITSTARAKVADGPFPGAPALSDAALGELRGGLRIGRFSFNFGLVVRSTIRGSMELVTQLTMDTPGQWQHVATHAWVAPQTSSEGGTIEQTETPPQQITSNSQNQTAGDDPTPQPFVAEPSSGGIEVAVGDPQGAQIIHQVTEGHLAALVSNQLNNQDIESITQLDISISNFREIVGPLLPAIRARRLVRGLGQP